MRAELAVIQDVEAIQALNQRLFEYEDEHFDKTLNLNWANSSKGKKYFTELVENEHAAVFVVRNEGEIVGYLAGRITNDKDQYRIFNLLAELENMFVLENWRSKGVGSILAEAFFTWAKQKGVENISVTASSGNAEAIKFYKKNGFKDHCVILEKEL